VIHMVRPGVLAAMTLACVSSGCRPNRTQLYATLPNAYGIDAHSPVTYLGANVGNVSGISFVDGQNRDLPPGVPGASSLISPVERQRCGAARRSDAGSVQRAPDAWSARRHTASGNRNQRGPMLDYLIHGPGFVHLLAGAILVSRAADIASTRLATPKLLLEANPLVRRLGWPYAYLTLLAALIPYWNLGFGLAVAVASFLIAGSNFSRGWIATALGEEAYLCVVVSAAQRISARAVLLRIWIGTACLLIPAYMLYSSSYDDKIGRAHV
jgi:hypothetical protein